MGNMGRLTFGIGHVLMEGAGGDGGTGGGGDGGNKGGGAAVPFADANAARAFVKDYVPGDDYHKAFDDTKIIPLAAHLKTKVDEFGTRFPANWRDQFAGENKDNLKTLERFARPHDVFNSYTALRTKLADGSLRPVEPFPANGAPEAQAAWRTANGVPQTSDDYVKNLKLGTGFKIESDEDKGIIKGFADYAHKQHLPQGAVDSMVNWMFESRRSGEETRIAQDQQQQREAEDALRTMYGPDYRGNTGRIGPFLDTAPEGVKDTLMAARGPDGRMLMHNPKAVDWLVTLARQINPAGVVIPGSEGNLTQSIESEIKTIEAKIGTQEYIKDEKMQARLRDLYDGYSKATGKQWGK